MPAGILVTEVVAAETAIMAAVAFFFAFSLAMRS